MCSCCHQKLFKHQVEEFSEIIKKKIDDVESSIRAKCITEEVHIDLGNEATSSYLCKSCKKSLANGKMPKLCTKNGLKLDKVDPHLRLTELENNLIVQLGPSFKSQVQGLD